MKASEEHAPPVSVIMAVYNGETYLESAIESVLTQTFKNFEFIIVNDGSTDRTSVLLDRLKDRRLRIIHQKNTGLARALNCAIAQCHGRYIARQDADDMWQPEKLAKQLAYLEAHPDCALLGTWCTIWENNQMTEEANRPAYDNGELQMRLLMHNPFIHASVVFRRSALDLTGPYPTDPKRYPPEDLDLWVRLARQFEVANVPCELLMRRRVAGSLSRRKKKTLASAKNDHNKRTCARRSGRDGARSRCCGCSGSFYAQL